MEDFYIGILGGTVGILLAILAWIGSRVHTQLDAINHTLIKIDKDLRKETVM